MEDLSSTTKEDVPPSEKEAAKHETITGTPATAVHPDRSIGAEDSAAHQKKNPLTAENEESKNAAKTSTHDPSSALVPQLAAAGITQAQLETAVQVLTAVGDLLVPKKQKPKKYSRRNKKRKNDESTAVATTETTEDGDASMNKDDERMAQYQQSNLRPLRKALAACLPLQQQRLQAGQEATVQKLVDRATKKQKRAEQVQQQKYIASAGLRQARVQKLRALQESAMDEEQAKVLQITNGLAENGDASNSDRLQLLQMMVPDGHAETTASSTTNLAEGPTTVTEEEATEEGAARNPDKSASEGDDSSSTKQLPLLRSCYVCKVRYRELHHFYDQLCPSCAALNWTKRHATCDLKGRIAVVTGARVKIGRQTVLALLRNNCTVVATTRFPQTAAATYRQEADFEEWKDRLHIYGLDLRDVSGLEAFTRFLQQQYGDNGIDMLINNACQTVRRPRAYYSPIVEQEQSLWEAAGDEHKRLLRRCAEFEQIRRKVLLFSEDDNGSAAMSATSARRLEEGTSDSSGAGCLNTTEDTPMENASTNVGASSMLVATPSSAEAKQAIVKGDQVEAPFSTTGLSHSAAMSQMVLLPEDVGVSGSVLPPGMTDINGHQLDLRKTNSWLLKMDQVSTPEMLECMMINAIAPFVLNSRLIPLMTTTPTGSAERPDRYIINVSAMEGKFYRYKMPNHPHTNMAKAALNMLTRTSAEELAEKHRIYMNSVDTGWINDENPLHKAHKIAVNNKFQTPIDEVDAAARILDPVFSHVNATSGGTNGGEDEASHACYGKFLKDYRETEW